MVVASGLAEVGLHEFGRLVAHVEAGVEPKRVHLGAGRRPNAVEFADGQVLYESRPHLWRDDILAVPLAGGGGGFREKFVVGYPGGGVEPRLLLELGADLHRAYYPLKLVEEQRVRI